MGRHVGRVLVDEHIILHWLQYDGGRIHHIGRSEDFMAISIIMEHPDMPKVVEGQMLEIVNPFYHWEDVYRTSPKMGIRTKIRRFLGKVKIRDSI